MPVLRRSPIPVLKEGGDRKEKKNGEGNERGREDKGVGKDGRDGTVYRVIGLPLVQRRAWINVQKVSRQTSSVIDDDADMLLSTVVQRVEKQLKLSRRLATEH